MCLNFSRPGVCLATAGYVSNAGDAVCAMS